jgi:hypothetical protein
MNTLDLRPMSEAPRDGTRFLALLSNDVWSILHAPDTLAQGLRYQWWRGEREFPVPIEDTHDVGPILGYGIRAVGWASLPEITPTDHPDALAAVESTGGADGE